MTNLKERNELIFSQRLNGRTLKSIADEHGICSQRVREICAKMERKAKAYDNMKSNLSAQVKKLKSDLRYYQLRIEDGMSVNDLPLSERTRNALSVGNIKTVNQVKMMTNQELLKLPNFGRKSLNELKEVVLHNDTDK